jgi:DNA mismatch repair protein MutL
MLPVIQPLPTDVVHLIAAGEVIDSLAAVVRELIENALDAGATRISISLWTEQWRVRVADNGRGMTLPDLQQAAAPHTTSKIRNSGDLWKIGTLGFRGEALYSLAQLAELEILSHATGASEGWWVKYNEQGQVEAVETAAIAPGTIVIVSNLFGTWSARRAGLPSTNQQLKSIQNLIQRIALCHPHVTWQVEQNDRAWFSIWAGQTAQDILPQILREVHPTDLQALRAELKLPKAAPPAEMAEPAHSSSNFSQPELYLLIGLPDRCHRRRPDWVQIAVNGRVVRMPELEQTVFAGFRRTLPRDRYPVCFIHLQLPADQIDWNRHPAKSEIYLHHLADWQTQMAQAIEQTLHLNTDHLSETLYSVRVNQLLKTAEAQGGYLTSRTISSVFEVEDEAAVNEKETHLHLPLKALAQVHNTYILVEHPTGLWLVEQHIAHERVLYEQICDRWQIVPLEPAIILSQLTPAQQEQLQRLGLQVDSFGEQLWAVRNAPELLVDREDCTDALIELSLGGDLQSAQVAVACRSAIRNGKPLTLEEMQTLLDQWQRTRNPRTCPHGRPIFLSLEESSLARFFRRHWVIGKSHGI